MDYYMPVKLFKGSIKDYGNEFCGYGRKAFVVTGKSSSKNGALDDCLYILLDKNIEYVIFDDVEENPSVENTENGANLGKKEKVDFIIAIGGGSPLDAAKAMGILIANPQKTGEDLFLPEELKTIPILAIPTTAGTGSETTPYSILTNHRVGTKVSINQFIFPEKAFLDYNYMENLPTNLTLSTALDAFSHLCDGYTSAFSNFFSDSLAVGGLHAFAKSVNNLEKREFTKEFRENIMQISSLAGMVIAQSKTSLPHRLSYALTYHKGVPHGYACCIFMYEYLKMCKSFECVNGKVDNIIKFLNMDSLENLKAFLDKAIDIKINVSKEEIEKYAEALMDDKAKLMATPFDVNKEILVDIYSKSLSL